MPKAKQTFEAAAWFCDGLKAGDDYSRETAKADCEAAMGRASAKHRVEIGPLRWSELKVGDAGVPAPPSNAPDGVKLLHVEGTVIGPWKCLTKVKGAKQIERPDPVAASSGRFGDAPIVSACRDGDCNSIRHLAGAVEGAILDRDRRMRAEGSEGITAVRQPGEIANSEAGYFVYRLVRACGEHGHAPPPELIRLVQTFTKQDRPPRGTGHRTDSGWLAKAAAHWRDNPDASPADIARAAKVHRSTVGKAINSGRLPSPIVADKEVP